MNTCWSTGSHSMIFLPTCPSSFCILMGLLKIRKHCKSAEWVSKRISDTELENGGDAFVMGGVGGPLGAPWIIIPRRKWRIGLDPQCRSSVYLGFLICDLTFKVCWMVQLYSQGKSGNKRRGWWSRHGWILPALCVKLGVRILSTMRDHQSLLNRRVTWTDLKFYEDLFAALWESQCYCFIPPCFTL